jgi:hypothetical protein
MPFFKHILFLLLIWGVSFPIFAEESSAEPAQLTPKEKLAELKKQARGLLLNKLKTNENEWAKIFVLAPIDYTNLSSTEFFSEMVQETIEGYDKELEVKPSNYQLPAINLEQLRIAMATLQADILVISVVLSGNVDVYIYDRKNPIEIFGYSEGFVEGPQEKLEVEMAKHYSKNVLRKALFKYISNQPFELPRDNSAPILKLEIPRSIASYRTVEMINREATANFYGSIGWGATLSSGQSGKLWNSNLVSLQLGFNLYKDWYLEAAGEMSAYNIASGSLKYLVSNREEPLRFMVGIGGSISTDRHTLDWDPTNDIKGTQIYAVPSASILLPISDVFLKLEAKAHLGVTTQSRIFSIFPAIQMFF